MFHDMHLYMQYNLIHQYFRNDIFLISLIYFNYQIIMDHLSDVVMQQIT